MDALDGNAAGGVLLDVYGVEMTTVEGSCVMCRYVGPLAEVAVYLDAPGVVLRCRNCDAVLLVVVERDGVKCVDSRGVRMRPN
jgi:hypothetical protein